MEFTVIWHGRQSRRASSKVKKRALHPSAAEPSPQADRGNSPAWPWGLGNCLFSFVSKCLPMPLLFHTLLPSEILDKHHLCTPGNSCTCFSLAVHCCCRSFLFLGLWEDSPTSETSPVPWMAELAEDHLLVKRQEQLHFSWHFEKRKYFEMFFLFLHWHLLKF